MQLIVFMTQNLFVSFLIFWFGWTRRRSFEKDWWIDGISCYSTEASWRRWGGLASRPSMSSVSCSGGMVLFFSMWTSIPRSGFKRVCNFKFATFLPKRLQMSASVCATRGLVWRRQTFQHESFQELKRTSLTRSFPNHLRNVTDKQRRLRWWGRM